MAGGCAELPESSASKFRGRPGISQDENGSTEKLFTK